MVQNTPIEIFFEAICKDDLIKVLELFAENHQLLEQRQQGPACYPKEFELEAMPLFGAYIGPLTGLQYAIILGHDAIALAIIESTFTKDLDTTYGVSYF